MLLTEQKEGNLA